MLLLIQYIINYTAVVLPQFIKSGIFVKWCKVGVAICTFIAFPSTEPRSLLRGLSCFSLWLWRPLFLLVSRGSEQALSPSISPIRAKQIPFTVELLKLMNDLRPEVPTPTFPYPRTLSPHKLRTLLRDRVDRFGKDDQQVSAIRGIYRGRGGGGGKGRGRGGARRGDIGVSFSR